MADLENTIDDLVVGDDFDVIRDITIIPASQTITEAWMTVREESWSSSAVFTKHITPTISGDGLIEDTGADTVGRVIFTLLNTDTIELHEYFSYAYDIQIKTSAGKLYTLESGLSEV